MGDSVCRSDEVAGTGEEVRHMMRESDGERERRKELEKIAGDRGVP